MTEELKLDSRERSNFIFIRDSRDSYFHARDLTFGLSVEKSTRLLQNSRCTLSFWPRSSRRDTRWEVHILRENHTEHTLQRVSVLGSASTSVPDTEYVLLQASPLYHWVPVSDEPGSSDDSSHDSTVFLQRTNSQRSIASQRSTRSACSHKPLKRTGSNVSTRPSSLFVSPPPSPKPAFRSKSTDEKYMGNNIPLKTTSSSSSSCLKKKRSTSTNDEVVISMPTSSLEKLSKLRDRLIGGGVQNSPAPGGESDDESTPLVSELSTPTHSQSDSVFRHESAENSSSPSSNRSLPRDGERCCIELDYSDTVSLVIWESSGDARPQFQQESADNHWDNTETPVWYSILSSASDCATFHSTKDGNP